MLALRCNNFSGSIKKASICLTTQLTASDSLRRRTLGLPRRCTFTPRLLRGSLGKTLFHSLVIEAGQLHSAMSAHFIRQKRSSLAVEHNYPLIPGVASNFSTTSSLGLSTRSKTCLQRDGRNSDQSGILKIIPTLEDLQSLKSPTFSWLVQAIFMPRL